MFQISDLLNSATTTLKHLKIWKSQKELWSALSRATNNTLKQLQLAAFKKN